MDMDRQQLLTEVLNYLYYLKIPARPRNGTDDDIEDWEKNLLGANLDCLEHLQMLYAGYFNENNEDEKPPYRDDLYWFHDLWGVVKEPHKNTDMLLLLLVECGGIIYGNTDKDVSRKFEKCIKNFQTIVRSYLFFSSECKTLSYAEKQQRAFEKELTVYGEEYSYSFTLENWDKILCPKFFDKLHDLMLEYRFHKIFQDEKKQEWIDRCRCFCEKVQKQPIAAMLLPILLTIYIVDSLDKKKDEKSIYSLLKYKNRRFTSRRLLDVQKLFQNICSEIMEENRNLYKELKSFASSILSDYDPFHFPIFNWKQINHDFCKNHKLLDKHNEVAIWFQKLLYKNAPSKGEVIELQKNIFSGKELQATAKMCNLNTYYRFITQTEGRTKVMKQFELLADGALLPLPNKKELSVRYNQENYPYYLQGYYQKSTHLPAIALCRYFRIKISSDFLTDLFFVNKLQTNFEKISSHFFDEICRYFSPEDNIHKNIGVWILSKSMDQIVVEQRLIDFVSRKFSENDCDLFLSDVKSFEPEGFEQFLNSFCSRNNIAIYDKISDYQKPSALYVAFKAVMSLIQAFLAGKYLAFWQYTLSKLLYGEI